jgi:hypothetical protein
MQATLAAPKDLFNDLPQSLFLAKHHKSAYIFVHNVVLEELRRVTLK